MPPDPGVSLGARPAADRLLSSIALASGLYDLLLAACLLFGRGVLAAWFGVPLPVPPIHADLNALFLAAIGAGYALPWFDPVRYRGYLWVMGPFLKGVGALAFVADHFLRSSPASYLLFALGDGTLAVVTWWGLRKTEAASRGR